MYHRSRARHALALLLAGGLAACGLNQSGNVEATRLGDTSHPTERGSALQPRVDACGDGAPTTAGKPVLHRQPYLQQVTQRSAIVGWVAPTEGLTVAVTLPDGTPVSTSTGAGETGAVVRHRGDHQTWAKLSGLEPDTMYCYALAGADHQPLTERAGFKTAPAADDPDPIRFLVFGDSGSGDSDQKALLSQMDTVPYDFMVHVGDLAYDDGTIAQFEDHLFSIYAPFLRSMPFFPIAGNHEYQTSSAKPFRDVFALPNNEKWYSFDWGKIHFVGLDTEQDYATQAAWLDQDLSKTQLPWKIVFMHKPLYSSGDHGVDDKAIKIFAPVFEKHGVQLVLAGHDHHYERMKPQRGVNYMVSGGGGRGTRSAGESDFTAFSEEVIHFLQIEVTSDRLIAHAIDAGGKEFDALVIDRSR